MIIKIYIFTVVSAVISALDKNALYFLCADFIMIVVSELRQVGGFPRAPLFPPPIKLTDTIQLKYC